jgi:hypothetical protein
VRPGAAADGPAGGLATNYKRGFPTMQTFAAGAGAEDLLLRLSGVRERCREQRAMLALEREKLQLGRRLGEIEARLLLRRAYLSREVEAVVRPLVESVRQK